MRCILCKVELNRERDNCFIHPQIAKITVCKLCGKNLIEALFIDKDFNEWLDSFLQSRIEKYIPEYNEYFERYNKKKCPLCSGSGFLNGKVCSRCHFVGVIDA